MPSGERSWIASSASTTLGSAALMFSDIRSTPPAVHFALQDAARG
jgi:hypothetical protein